MWAHLAALDYGRVDAASARYTIRINGHLGAALLSAFPAMAWKRRPRWPVCSMDHELLVKNAVSTARTQGLRGARGALHREVASGGLPTIPELASLLDMKPSTGRQ